MHGSVSILILHVDVGALCHQQLHQLGVPLRHCQLQRRLVAVVPDVDVAASLREFGCFTELMELNPRVESGSTCWLCSGLQLTSLMRISATSRWLLRAARCNAEKPSSFLTSTSCRARARIFSVALPGQRPQD